MCLRDRVYAALVRVMNEITSDEKHRQDYLNDFMAMRNALKQCQREDGFWNVSLHDPSNFGGKETSGTALFIYGMAWGVPVSYTHLDVYKRQAQTVPDKKEILKVTLHVNDYFMKKYADYRTPSFVKKVECH